MTGKQGLLLLLSVIASLCRRLWQTLPLFYPLTLPHKRRGVVLRSPTSPSLNPHRDCASTSAPATHTGSRRGEEETLTHRRESHTRAEQSTATLPAAAFPLI